MKCDLAMYTLPKSGVMCNVSVLFYFVFLFCGAQCQLTNIYFFCVGVTHAGDAQSFTGIKEVCLMWRRKAGGTKCFAIKGHEAG